MNFQDLEHRFGELKQQHDAGSISDPDFDREREQLKTQDERGVWWTKGKTGDWYFHDGTTWQPGDPQLMGGHPSGPMPAATGWSPGQQTPQGQQAQGNAGLMVGLGIGSAVLALIVLPIIFGPLGIFFGYRATRLGNRSGGRGVMIASAVCMVISMVIGAVVLTSMR